MLIFLICLTLTITSAEEFENGLHFKNDGAYAPNYHNYAPKDYHFDYFVSDPHTGDHKSQWEVKEKGVVKGGYSLVEPDGTTRVVEYIADKHGFRAIVKKIGHSGLPEHIEAHGFHGIAEDHPHAYDGRAENYANLITEPEPVYHINGFDHHLNQHKIQEDEAQIYVPQGTFSEEARGFVVNKPIEIVQHHQPQVYPQIYDFQKPQEIIYESKEPRGFILENQPISYFGQDKITDYRIHGANHNPEDDSEYSQDYYEENYGNIGAYSEHVPAKVPPAPFSLQPKLVKALPYHFTINHSVQ